MALFSSDAESPPIRGPQLGMLHLATICWKCMTPPLGHIYNAGVIHFHIRVLKVNWMIYYSWHIIHIPTFIDQYYQQSESSKQCIWPIPSPFTIVLNDHIRCSSAVSVPGLFSTDTKWTVQWPRFVVAAWLGAPRSWLYTKICTGGPHIQVMPKTRYVYWT